MDNSEKVAFLPIESAQNTDAGRKRPNNEDWVAGFEPTNPLEIQGSGSLYIVADGVGGASRGERASQHAAERVLFDFFQEPNVDPAIRLQNAMRSVCKEIFEYAQDNNLSRMATTMVAANIRGNVLTVANVGDSRCYLIRSGKVVQITQDHNVAAELVRNGSLTAEDAKHTKSGNTLLRSIGGDPDVDVDIFGEIDLFPGDIVLLCSDGLTRYLENETLLRLCADGTAEQITHRLIGYANKSGGADNISVYVIKVGSDAGKKDFDEEKTIPAPITLDTNRPKKSKAQKRRSAFQKKSMSRGKIVNIGLLSLLVLVLLFGIFYLTSRDKDLTVNPELASLTSPTSGLAVVPPVEPTTSTTDTVVTNDTDDPLISLTEVILTPEVTQSPNVILTATLPPQDTLASNPIPYCVHVVQEGFPISTIFDQFGLNWTEHEPFTRFNSCDVENEICSETMLTIDDPENIRSGWFLNIPEVNEELCRSVDNSFWFVLNP